MKINQEPLSAFAVYSEKLKQKKKSKLSKPMKVDNKVHKKKSHGNNLQHIGLKEIEEIGYIMKTLANNKLKNASSDSVKENSKKDLENKYSNGKIRVLKKGRNKLKAENLTNGHTKPSKFEMTKSKEISKKENIYKKYKKNNKVTKISDISPEVEINLSSERNKHKHSKTSSPEPFINSSNELKPLNAKKKTTINEVKKTASMNKTNLKNKSKINMLDKPVLSEISDVAATVFTNKKNSAKEKPILNKTTFKRNIGAQQVGTQNEKKQRDWTNQENSIQTARCLFEWVIAPMEHHIFMRDYWEKRPLLIQREGNRKYFSELLSTPVIDAMLRENNICFTKHLDVTSYTDGKRETHNLSGRAQANVVWDFYSNGCSVRLLNPQAFVPKVHALNASLQEYFGCFVGANVYLTPPNSQGFAPHYDDIEAFVLQIEGKKHWKVYQPRNDEETLPRYSSPNFTQEEIGKPFLDVVLEPGDMLYFPRGFIHQASTVEGEHSLHITLSAYQKTAWVDLLEKALPIALKRAAKEDVEFRRGLPRDYLGLEHHGSDIAKVDFVETAMSLVLRLGHFLSISLGAGVDQMGAQFMHDALPPVFIPEEKQSSGLGGGLKMVENGELKNRVEIDLNTKVKLIRANICRIVEEEDEVRLYHCLDNPLEYHAEEPQFLVLPREGVSVITVLARKYPAYVLVRNLPHKDQEILLTLVSDLWDAGLLLAKDLQTEG